MSSNSSDLFDCVQAFVCDCQFGAVTADQLDEFEQLLDRSEEAKDLYAELIELSVYLPRALVGAVSEVDTSPLDTMARNEINVRPVQINVDFPRQQSSSFWGCLQSVSFGWPVAYLIAAAILSVAMLIGNFTYVSRYEEVADNFPPMAVEHQLKSRPKAEIVGRITGLVNCKWANPQTALASSHVGMRQKITLASGLMEITYDTGAKVILQGPVTYEVGRNGGYLAVGKLTGKLEKKVVGNQNSSNSQSLSPNPFVIHTPTATATDLGTEFGIEVNEKGTTEAQVFAGMVKITTRGGDDNGQSKEQVILAGSAVRIDGIGNRATSIQPNAGRFVRSLQPYGQDARTHEYAKLVLSLNPVVYYRMEQWPKTDKDDCYVLVDSAPGHHQGELRLDRAFGPPQSRGKFGDGLYFRGPMVDSYAVVPDYPKPQNGQLSVSVWVRAYAFFETYSPIVSNMLAVPPCPGQFYLGTNEAMNLMVDVRQESGVPIEIVDRALLRNQWQHVAFVADGAVLHLYRNGVEVGAKPCRRIARQPVPTDLGIGCTTDMVGSGSQAGKYKSHTWIGHVDELAIFNHALTAEQVLELFTGPATVPAKMNKQAGAGTSEKEETAVSK
jgi:hypothetical protein